MDRPVLSISGHLKASRHSAISLQRIALKGDKSRIQILFKCLRYDHQKVFRLTGMGNSAHSHNRTSHTFQHALHLLFKDVFLGETISINIIKPDFDPFNTASLEISRKLIDSPLKTNGTLACLNPVYRIVSSVDLKPRKATSTRSFLKETVAKPQGAYGIILH